MPGAVKVIQLQYLPACLPVVTKRVSTYAVRVLGLLLC